MKKRKIDDFFARVSNSNAITTLILEELEERGGLDLSSFTGLTSDGASVMVGKRSGVAARLKQPSSLEGQQLVKAAVNAWLENRNRRKLPKQSGSATVTAASATSVIDVEDAGVQTDPYMDVSEDVIRTAVDIALKKLSLDEYDAGDSDSDWSDDEDCVDMSVNKERSMNWTNDEEATLVANCVNSHKVIFKKMYEDGFIYKYCHFNVTEI
ncbi:hypothetical protein MAR_003530 [Mya arenaria]|uniref:Uncharacterized protein n=1 Tax=Mya arenaria TaxID=6604 RepID=A0ABY7G692_MYAAR|nr:hypothetical protein MAR_003530 [Mya arenaria]